MLERKWFFLHFRALLPESSLSDCDSLPPPPRENTTDLHVHEHEEAVRLCLVSGSEVGAGMLGGKPKAGLGQLKVHWPPLQLPRPIPISALQSI